MRSALIFLGGLVVGVVSMVVVTAGDEGVESEFEELEAAVVEVDEGETGVAAGVDDGVDEAEDRDEASCQETLAMVSEAHAAAIEKYSENQEMVEYLEDLVERSGAGSPEGRAMEFPEQLDERFHPEQFQESVGELMERCPDFFGEDTQVDCDEFPCMIEFQTDDRPRDINFGERCPAVDEHLGGGGLRSFGFQLGDDVIVHLVPQGTGVGLRDHLNDYEGNLDKRTMHRWETRRRDLSAERYEEACMFEGDGDACLEMARALWGESEEREVYLVLGCEEGNASSCYSYAQSRCVERARCDATSEEFARRAIRLEGDVEGFHRTLGVVLCERGKSAAAEAAWQDACKMGDASSCERRCG